MRRYETVFIIDPEVTEEIRDQILDKIQDTIEAHKGFFVLFDQWGIKKLAYEIKKRVRGYYVCMNYCGESDLVNELERSFRLDDKVLKFMTILLEKEIDIEKVKQEVAMQSEQATPENQDQESDEKTSSSDEETSSSDEETSSSDEETSSSNEETSSSNEETSSSNDDEDSERNEVTETEQETEE